MVHSGGWWRTDYIDCEVGIKEHSQGAIAVIQEKDANGLSQGNSSVTDKNGSWHIVTIEPPEFADGLDDRCGRERSIKDDPNVSGWRNWTRL